MTSSTLLEVDGLSAGYGDLVILTDVELTVWAGKVTAVFGANGAGKTTLLKAIAGLLPVRGGTVTLDGSSIVRMAAHQRTRHGIALVQEGKRVFHRLSVAQNLRLGGYGVSAHERSEGIQRSYEQFPALYDKRGARAGSLSGGQQQMLAIAQALIPQPKVLMLDEPSAGLAPIIVNELLTTIDALRRSGMGIVLVEQLVGKALTIADHVVILQQGRVAMDTPVGNLHDDDLRDAYLGRAAARAAE